MIKFVHLLSLSFVVSPSVQPSLPHVSHSPSGTPPSSAVHAGILHSCHTYIKKEKHKFFFTNAIMCVFIIALVPVSGVRIWPDRKGLTSIFFFSWEKTNKCINKMSSHIAKGYGSHRRDSWGNMSGIEQLLLSAQLHMPLLSA